MIDIVQKEDPVLRKIAEEVPILEITSPKIRNILRGMKEALHSQDDGVAIAAPQIGAALRIFVVSGKAFLYDKENQKEDGYGEKQKGKIPPDMIFINPEILKLSRKKYVVPEGCLSVRWLYGKTVRSDKAKITAYDESGKQFTYGGSGLIAQIFQHETDHLNGILFIDHATDVQEMVPEKRDGNMES
ncbi:MAG: peptide deformylase [Parcubacteria group bacterium]|nr:peptide deformylase [Parcubacteria group bacterium]